MYNIPYHLSDFFRSTISAGRNFFFKSLSLFAGKLIIHRGIDYSAGNRINLNVTRCEFFGERFGKSVDAGLGSSALGATAFKKRLQKIGVEKTVRNYAIEKVPDEADVIVTHISLLDRARLKFPNRRIITIQNFMNDPNLDALFEEISNTEN